MNPPLELSQLQWIFALLSLFQLKHFIADFPLQKEYMLQKVKPGWGFFLPLAVHCTVHGLLTLGIVLAIATSFWWLAVVDFVIHFLMDRIKAGPSYLGRYNDKSKPAYWNALGFDQMVHHLTSFYIVWVLVA